MVQFMNGLMLSVFVLTVFLVKLSSQSLLGNMPIPTTVSLNNVDLSCVTNSTCMKHVSNEIAKALSKRKSIDFGTFSIQPLENANKSLGRSSSTLWDVISKSTVRIPLGAYALTVQKTEEYDNYIEVAVAKQIEGRGRHERKTMKFFVPSFLVASQVGWWLLALAGVSLLSIKAFLVSKLALVIAAVMTLKKLFEHHSTPPQFYEHHEPLMVPYNFDLSGFSGPGFPSEFHPSLPLEQTAALHQTGSLGAETAAVNSVLSSGNNNTGGLSAAQTPGLSAYATVARNPLNYNYLGKNPYLFRKP